MLPLNTLPSAQSITANSSFLLCFWSRVARSMVCGSQLMVGCCSRCIWSGCVLSPSGFVQSCLYDSQHCRTCFCDTYCRKCSLNQATAQFTCAALSNTIQAAESGVQAPAPMTVLPPLHARLFAYDHAHNLSHGLHALQAVQSRHMIMHTTFPCSHPPPHHAR